jgi:hypothetical protein
MLQFFGSTAHREIKMSLFWSSTWKWIKQKWEWVVGFVIGLIALMTVMTRGRQQKRVLEVANESHEKENRINETAKEELADGLTKVIEENNKDVLKVIKESDKEKEELKNEKEEFIENNSGSDDLGKRIADHLGVEYVDSNKK